jgi:hypothetical protein
LSRLRLLSLFFHTIRYKGITLAASAIIIFLFWTDVNYDINDKNKYY